MWRGESGARVDLCVEGDVTAVDRGRSQDVEGGALQTLFNVH